MPIRGVRMSLTSAFTTAPNAVPITTATARSTTLPRSRNCLNSARMPFFSAIPSSFLRSPRWTALKVPQLLRQPPQGLPPVADRVLLVRREFRHRPCLAHLDTHVGDEPGVVAEASGPPGLEPDPPLAGTDTGDLV